MCRIPAAASQASNSICADLLAAEPRLAGRAVHGLGAMGLSAGRLL